MACWFDTTCAWVEFQGWQSLGLQRKGQVAKTMMNIVHEGDLKIQKLEIEVLWHSSSMPNSQINIACVSSHDPISLFSRFYEIPGSTTAWNSDIEEINYVKHHQGVWLMSLDCGTGVSASLHNWWLWNLQSSLYTHTWSANKPLVLVLPTISHLVWLWVQLHWGRCYLLPLVVNSAMMTWVAQLNSAWYKVQE